MCSDSGRPLCFRASLLLLFPVLPRTPSVQHEAGARGPGLHLLAASLASCSAWHRGEEGDVSLACLQGAGSACGDGRGRGGVIPPSVSPFSVSPVRETLRWQSRARRPSEVGGVWLSSALPPSIVSGSERRRAPAPAACSRDAPALRCGAGRLRRSRCDGFRVAAGSSRGPEEGDAACVCPALPPPREMNMSLPGRVSCSMLNCFAPAGPGLELENYRVRTAAPGELCAPAMATGSRQGCARPPPVLMLQDGEEGLKDTWAGGELRLPCSSSSSCWDFTVSC
ncbi:LOW QUALITY PROTEIN: uncharacterized protein LJ264_011634 [Porphyrio hochstetteri]